MSKKEKIEFFTKNGEDKILADLFFWKDDGFFVEIGAFDGKTDSICNYFDQYGWKGLIVEPLQECCEEMKEFRKNSNIINIAVGKYNSLDKVKFYIVENAKELSTTGAPNKFYSDLIKENGGITETREIELASLNNILQYHFGEIDIISINTQGHELEALEGFDIRKFKPRIMVISNPVQDQTIKISKYLKQFNYVSFLQTENKQWYAHKNNILFAFRNFYFLKQLIVKKSNFTKATLQDLKQSSPRNLFKSLISKIISYLDR